MSAERRPEFTITHDAEPTETLIAGFSGFGLAGLTAVDYLVNQLDLEETGHITADELPAIAPFENGTPRHHTRLFSGPNVDVTVLVNELFVPVWAADAFAEAVLAWTDGNGVDEVGLLSGIPLPHGPEDHRVFYVATPDFQERRLADVDVPPMGNGFLDGVNASLVSRGLTSALRAGVFVTPVHPRAPDVEAAIRLIDAVEQVYELDVDTEELESFAGEVEQYYRELGERLQAMGQEQVPEDRMYM